MDAEVIRDTTLSIAGILHLKEIGGPSIFPPVITPPIEVETTVPLPGNVNGPVYPSYAPKTDSDGNDIAGLRLPDVTVPIATYTGWGLRSGAQADDGCESTGQFIAFAATGEHAPRQGSSVGRRPTRRSTPTTCR
jgi:hypothetical protein